MKAIIYHKWEDKKLVIKEETFEALYEITNWNDEEVMVATWNNSVLEDLKEMCNKDKFRHTLLSHASGALGIIIKDVQFKMSFKEIPVTKKL